MEKFNVILFSYLPNAAHFNYCSRVNEELLVAGSAVINALGELPAEYRVWLAKETGLMEWVKKSDLTEQIVEADHRVDRALVAINAQVHALEFNPDVLVSAAALRVGIMLKNYGKVYRKPYEEEEGDVRAILLQFAGAYAADMALLPGIPEWVTELQGALTEFQQLLVQRDAHSLQKPKEGFRFVRRSIEGVYHQIVTLVDAGAALNTSPDFAAFIDRLNPEIARLNAEFHRVRRNMADAEPEPVPQQQYTGQPVTPTPNVYYVTPHDGTVKLQLGKDYNLTYKRNTDVGNAECTLHGKGLYRGSRTVTFVITR
ncbi:MAG: DUF6261 family protein [Tannerella sp.]|jgi:hypothetical protein|nr:DUF6261 family protein [Tannerella sp.]